MYVMYVYVHMYLQNHYILYTYTHIYIYIFVFLAAELVLQQEVLSESTAFFRLRLARLRLAPQRRHAATSSRRLRYSRTRPEGLNDH